MPIGDVTSNARGSGARYNDGKPDLALIPLDMVAESFEDEANTDFRHAVNFALATLGYFQTTGDINHLLASITAMSDSWRDCARVFEYGRRKYAAWNWAKGMAWSIPIACAARHALAILEGETTDQESGLPHAGHFLCNLVMLRHFVDHYPEGNDLPPPELFAKDIPPPHYDPDSVAFRHGDIDAVCGIRDAGEFTQPPNCVDGTKRRHLSTSTATSGHPMAAEGLRLADGQSCNQPRRSESAWSVTWPGEIGN